MPAAPGTLGVTIATPSPVGTILVATAPVGTARLVASSPGGSSADLSVTHTDDVVLGFGSLGGLAPTQLKALDAFNRALALDPYAPNVEYNIGLIHRDRGELDLAINAFKRALATNPHDRDARSLIERLENLRSDGQASSQ